MIDVYMTWHEQTDAYQTTGCYNLLCSGFVQTDSRVALGAAISPTSSFNGGQFDISLLIWKVCMHIIFTTHILCFPISLHHSRFAHIELNELYVGKQGKILTRFLCAPMYFFVWISHQLCMLVCVTFCTLQLHAPSTWKPQSAPVPLTLKWGDHHGLFSRC